jgi:hypothetical protein
MCRFQFSAAVSQQKGVRRDNSNHIKREPDAGNHFFASSFGFAFIVPSPSSRAAAARYLLSP